MSLEQSGPQPNKSLDFGRDGFTGSLSSWHELLQITAPDEECGLVFVRGDFPDDPDAILARAQRRNQRGTFGMTIHPPPRSGWVQEPTPARGLINLQWPYTQFSWTKNDDRFGAEQVALCSTCSFVHHDIIYQIARVIPRQMTTSSPNSSAENLRDMSAGNVEFTIDIGGIVRFGCPYTATRRRENTPLLIPPPFYDDYARTPPFEKESYVLSTTSHIHKKRLEIRLWVNHVPRKLKLHHCNVAEPLENPQPLLNNGHLACQYRAIGLHATQHEKLRRDEPTIIVAAFSLVDAREALNEKAVDVIPYMEVQQCLGVADDSPMAPYRLWSALLGSSSLSADSFELNAVGRAVETVLGVSCLPVRVNTRSANSEADLGIAMLNNIMSNQIVDLESTL